MVGGRLMTSRWVLFADADTWYEQGFLDAAVAGAESRGLDFLSVHLTPVPQSLPEHLLVPYLSALFFTGASLRREPATVFSGQCLLVRREAYEFIGGHAPVLTDLSEDVKLAVLAQRHRMKLSVARAGALGHARFYSGWRGIWDGIERNAFRISQVSHGASASILLTAAVTALWLPAVAWLWMKQEREAAALLTLLLLVLMRPWYGILRVLLAPIAIYAAIPFLLHGMLGALTHRPIRWKDRVI
jgi:chlorobactene glucosyltransferase